MRKSGSSTVIRLLTAALLLFWLAPAGTAGGEKHPRRRAAGSHAAPRHAGKAVPRRARRTAAKKKAKPVPAAASHVRDPFTPLIADTPGKKKRVVRPPGRRGLVIDEIQVQGTVRGPHGAVAVVSAPGGHVYFLRAGDRLFDGKVERIGLSGVEFIEHGRDALGRAFDRRVVKAVRPPAGVKR